MGHPAATYRLQVADLQQPVDAHSMREAEATMIGALAGRGMLEAPPDQPADIQIVLSYEIGTRTKKVKTSSYHLDPADSGHDAAAEPAFPPGNAAAVREHMMEEAAVASNEHDAQLYTEKVPEVLYQKYLTVSAYDAPPVASRPADHRIWYVVAGIEDENGALPKYVPILAAACVNSINTNTGRVKSVMIRTDGAALTIVKKVPIEARLID